MSQVHNSYYILLHSIWRTNFHYYISFGVRCEDKCAFADHKCRLFCVLGFVSILGNHHAGTTSRDILEASKSKVSCLSNDCFWTWALSGFVCEDYCRLWTIYSYMINHSYLTKLISNGKRFIFLFLRLFLSSFFPIYSFSVLMSKILYMYFIS